MIQRFFFTIYILILHHFRFPLALIYSVFFFFVSVLSQNEKNISVPSSVGMLFSCRARCDEKIKRPRFNARIKDAKVSYVKKKNKKKNEILLHLGVEYTLIETSPTTLPFLSRAVIIYCVLQVFVLLLPQ